jgi:hypothetical protein
MEIKNTPENQAWLDARDCYDAGHWPKMGSFYPEEHKAMVKEAKETYNFTDAEAEKYGNEMVRQFDDKDFLCGICGEVLDCLYQCARCEGEEELGEYSIYLGDDFGGSGVEINAETKEEALKQLIEYLDDDHYWKGTRTLDLTASR